VKRVPREANANCFAFVGAKPEAMCGRKPAPLEAGKREARAP